MEYYAKMGCTGVVSDSNHKKIKVPNDEKFSSYNIY